MSPRRADTKRCSRCYQYDGSVTFTGKNKKCDTCLYEQNVLNASSRAAEASNTHTGQIMMMKPDGDPILHEALSKRLDYDTIAEMCKASREVCKHQLTRARGAFRGRTPEDVIIEKLGDPNDVDDVEKRQKLNALICTYLSACINVSTWVGWYRPHGKRLTPREEK